MLTKIETPQSSCPCIDCLVLSMCRSKNIISLLGNESSRLISVSGLSQSCRLFRKWFNDTKNAEEQLSEIYKLDTYAKYCERKYK